MNFSTEEHLWIRAVLVILLGYYYCTLTAEEVCYRGDAYLEYDNPCSDESGQPSKLSVCPRGMRLADRCTEKCVYCDVGTYQDTFTNCSTCLPCTTAMDCPPGQVLISVCTAERNAICGCPASPPCPTCESCSTVPTCPPITPCPVQTECPACEYPTNAPATEVCPANQTAELGGQGYIRCNFPDDYTEVHWFDDISEITYPVISYRPNDRGKSGQDLESGAYDVHQDGSLIITNVSTWHEKGYKAVVFMESSLTPATFVIWLKVTASPVDDLPLIRYHNFHQEYYCSAMQGEILSCSFNATRPPVQLTWLKNFGGGYDGHVMEMQQFNSTENNNGTYNSLATVHLRKGGNFIQLLVCRATWPLSDWTREREILVDFSSSTSFSDVSSTVQHMEINRYTKIQCGQSASDYVVWKRIIRNSELAIIGFHSHIKTETMSDIPDVELSAEGSLIFASPRVKHEGIYVCIFGDGQNEEILVTSLEILIPPSPPYIQITGCDDVSHHCVIREDSTKELTCAVYGARPNVTLEWIAEDEISFFNHKEVFKERGETFDTILSVEYKVSQDVMCGKEILIKCYLYGPLSNIMKAESTVVVIPASCREDEVKEEHALNGVVIVSLVLNVLIIVTVIVIVIAVLIIYCKHRNQTNSATSTSYSGVSTRDPEGYRIKSRGRKKCYYCTCDHEGCRGTEVVQGECKNTELEDWPLNEIHHPCNFSREIIHVVCPDDILL